MLKFDNPKILREFDDEYGDQVALWFFAQRIDAFLIEQAVLQSTAIRAEAPEGLNEDWAGYGEVRRMPEEELIGLIQNLVEQHAELGRWEFVLNHIKRRRTHTYTR